MNLKKLFVLLALCALAFTGCVSSSSANVYSRKTAMKVQAVEKGTVESVKQILIEGTKTPIGTTVGAVSGGVLGSTIGSGSGKKMLSFYPAAAGPGALKR